MVRKLKTKEKLEIEKISEYCTIGYFDEEMLEKEWGVTWLPKGKYKHLSIAHPNRLPSWEEIKFFKEKNFGDNFVIQILPDKSRYVNIHNFCFHLWQYLGE